MTRFHACTVAARAQLPSARVLCESLRRHHPGTEVTTLVIDDGAGRDAPEARYVSPAEIGVPADVLARLAMACTPWELAESLTPWLVRHLLAEGAPVVVVLGPEVRVFEPLDDVVEIAAAHGVVLAPRVDAAVPNDGLEPTPSEVEAAGPFASGFVAVGTRASALVDGWREGQKVPPPGHVLDDPGCAVSAWNLHTRELDAARDQYEVSGRPLRWFDFRGYSPDQPHLLSTEFKRPRALISDNPALARLCDEHGAHLRAAGFDARASEYGYDALPDAKPIDERMRRMYIDALYEARTRGKAEPPSPFGDEGADAFVAWVTELVTPPVDPQVSRYLTRVRDEKEILQHVYPSLGGEGAEQYLAWARTRGHDDEGIPRWVLPSEDNVIALTKRRWRARPAGSWPHGVNVVGYVTAVLGVGHVARVLTAMLDDAGVPRFVVANRETTSETSLSFDSGVSIDATFDVNLLCVNADHTTLLAEQLGPDFFAGRRTVGLWFWEVENFPASMMPAFELIDEVWVASDFVLESIAAVAPKPVRKFPLPVIVPTPPSGITRSALGLPDDRFVFLFVYDFLSTAERKNPIGLIEAYTKAFGPDDGAVLVLKSINGEQRLPELERVRRAAAGRPDVIVRDAYLAPDHHAALLAECDAYVSLHRSEGFGLDMAAEMGLGQPVIATRYSGNLEFMDDATAYLVDYDLEPVGPGNAPYPPDSQWAHPRLDHAAELMRRVVERPEEARERGRRAADRIRNDFSVAARSRALAAMVDDARARGENRSAWRSFFMSGWRARRDRVEGVPYGALDWLPDGAEVDTTMRRLLAEQPVDASPINPEADLAGFYRWLNEPVFPAKSPFVSRYLYRLWRDRPDLQAHFSDIEADPRTYLAFLVERGHADTNIPYRLLPTDVAVRRAMRYQAWRARREKVGRAIRSAGQRAAGLVHRR